MGQKFRDQAGNIWEQGPDGQPVFVSGPQQSIQTKPADPKLPGQLQNQQLNNIQTQQQIAAQPIQQQGQVLSNQRTAQDIQFERSKVAADLANKYNNDQRVIEYRTVLPQVASAMAASPGKQGDLSVVYAWAKTMDPQGSVREGDTEMANSTSSYVQQAQQWVASINQGKGLPKAVRDGLIAEMRNKGHQLGLAYVQARQDYGRLAQQGQIPVDVVIGQNDSAKYDPVEAKYRNSLPTAGKTQTNIDPQGTASLDSFIKRGAPFDEANKWVREQGGSPLSLKSYKQAVEFAKANPNYSGSLAEFTRTTETSPIQQALGNLVGPGDIGYVKGFKGALDRAAVGVEGLYNSVVPQSMESNGASQAQQNTNQFFADKNVDPNAEWWGRLPGSTVLSAPLTNPWLAGAAGNALMTDSTGLGAVGDAAVGAVGGKVADTVLRGGAQLLAPQLDPAVSNLAGEGARLTPGRFFPGLKKTEDLARSYPIVGSKIDDAMNAATASVNLIPPKRILGHIGQTLPDNVPAGHEAVGYTQRAVGDFYDQNLNGTAFNLDPTFITRLNYMGQRNPLRPQEFEQFNDIVQRDVGGIFSKGMGKATGRDFKRLDSRLGSISSKLQSSADDPFKVQLGDQVEMLQDQVRHLFRRQNPAQAANLRQADKAWADFIPYQRAAAQDLENGIATPGMFRNAVRQSDNTLRKGAVARGEARMQDFAIDASKVIPAERANSGSADRLNLASAKAWGIGAAASPLYSEPAIDLLNLLVKRKPDKVSETTAKVLRSLPRGMFGGMIPLGVYPASGN